MNANLTRIVASVGAGPAIALLLLASARSHAVTEHNASAVLFASNRARTKRTVQTVATLAISGVVGKPHRWTNAQIQSEFAGQIKEIEYTLKGMPHKAHCLPLLTLLEAAQPHYDAKIKHHALAFAVALRSGDGYTITLSMGELLPDYGNKEAWLALDQDGQPLPASETPARLILLGDAKPSRWIQGVSTITVFDGLKLLRTKGKPMQEPAPPASSL